MYASIYSARLFFHISGYHHPVPRTDTASRVIIVPSERVYSALVDPDALTAWLPPNGMTGTFERFDLRQGGSYRMVLTYADPSISGGKAGSDIVEARFRRPRPWRASSPGGGLRL
jgi:uncharacterized protein YndB with AHSA1/START domain